VSLPSARPLIYFISDGAATDRDYDAAADRLIGLIVAAVRAKIPLIQIREKRLSASLLFDLAKRTADVVRNSQSRLLINDRLDIAVAAGADGVHLTSHSFRPHAVRQLLPPEFLIGVSTHSIAEIELAQSEGADFAVYGPIFPTGNKGGPVGLDGLHTAAVRFSGFPIIGLGGISSENFRDTLDTRAAGFAGISLFNNAENIKKLGDILYQ
jgi:thiamine-phosphate pyrophosphorylase